MAGPKPLHSPLIPVTKPCTSPCLSASACMETKAEMAGYVMEDTLARTPADHIIQVWDPKPYLGNTFISCRSNILTAAAYHISCSISNSSPTMMVCLGPIVFIRRVNKPVWAITERMPMAAMNMATVSLLNPITNLR